MTSSKFHVTNVLARILLVAAGITGAGCASDGIDAAATQSANANDQESIVTASEPDSADRGRELAEANCVQCHGPGFLPTYKQSKSDWLVTIDRMLTQYGEMMDGAASAATMTLEERDILADYLAGN
jgi:mono/diheme cytochrome c family protein